ncbi:MAG TPA: DUF4286 domain-containing protein [Phycisphaerales bacterium]|nr:DUF4286 domain-containing protein [Phycisphaerales bacterium]
MPVTAYTVIATFPDRATLEEFVAWLEDGHIDQVLAHGGHSAMIVRMDRVAEKDPHRVEVRYLFSTRENFDRYIQHHAPGLRAEGLKRFPAERGVKFERTVGEVV